MRRSGITFNNILVVLIIVAILLGAGLYLAGIISIPFFYVLACIACIWALRFPFVTLLGFVFLIPLEDALIISSGLTFNRLIGLGLIVTFLLNIKPSHLRSNINIPKSGGIIILWFLLGILSLLWSFNPNQTMLRLITEFQLITFMIIAVNMINTPQRFRITLYIFLLSTVILAILGMYSLITHQNFVDAGRAIAIEGQSETTFAALLGAGAAISLPLAVHGKPNLRILFLAISMIFIAGIISTAGRGALVSIGVVILLLIWSFRDSISNTIFAGIILIVLVVVTALFTVELGLVTESAAARLNLERSIETGGSNRTNIWLGHLLYTVPESPLLGYGVGTAVYIHGESIEATELAGIGYRDSHSNLIQMLVDLGIVGLFLWLFIHYNIWSNLSKCYRNAKQSNLEDVYWVSKSLLLQLFVAGLTATFIWDKRQFFGFALAIVAVILFENTVPDEQVLFLKRV